MNAASSMTHSDGVRRLIYAGLLVALAIPFFVPWHLPSHVSPETRGLFDEIERLATRPEGAMVLLMSDWGPGTKGENQPQFTGLARHLIARRIPFAVLTVMSDPVGMYFANDLLGSLVEHANQGLGDGEEPLRYGIDWINLGMKTKGERGGDSIIPLLQAFCHDVHAFTVTDIEGRPVGGFPIMERLRTIEDVDLVMEVSAGELETLDWLGAIQTRRPELSVGLATMSIVATKMLPYFKAGQLVGLLDGSRGADEYNALLRQHLFAGEATSDLAQDRRKNALSTGRMFVIAMIFMGNMLFWRRRTRRGSWRRGS